MSRKTTPRPRTAPRPANGLRFLNAVSTTARSAKRPRATDDEVRARAYAKWEAAGRPAGDGVAFWLAAERELRA